MSPILLTLLAYVAAAGVLTLTPGVDTVMVVRSSTSHGASAGAAAGLGICAGLFVWGAGAALGLTALLSASALAFNALKIAGAAYLLFLGVKLLWKPRGALEACTIPETAKGASGALRRGFLTNVLNPKVGVFYVTFLPQFIPDGVNAAAFSMLLAAIHALLAAVWFGLLIALTVPLGRFIRRPSVVATLDRLTGCVFVAFGVKLAAAQRG